MADVLGGLKKFDFGYQYKTIWQSSSQVSALHEELDDQMGTGKVPLPSTHWSIFHHIYYYYYYMRCADITITITDILNITTCITIIVGLNVFIKDNQQAYCLRVVLQQIYMRDIHGILQDVHICQHKKKS